MVRERRIGNRRGGSRGSRGFRGSQRGGRQDFKMEILLLLIFQIRSSFRGRGNERRNLGGRRYSDDRRGPRQERQEGNFKRRGDRVKMKI